MCDKVSSVPDKYEDPSKSFVPFNNKLTVNVERVTIITNNTCIAQLHHDSSHNDISTPIYETFHVQSVLIMEDFCYKNSLQLVKLYMKLGISAGNLALSHVQTKY